MSSHHRKPELPADGISVKTIDDQGVTHVVAIGKSFDPEVIEEIRFANFHPLGRGAFGTVTKAMLLSTNEMVAIKRVPTIENIGELNTLRILEHCNIIDLKYFFRTRSEGIVYLHLMTDAMPCDLHVLLLERLLSPFEIRLYSYQLFRAVAYMHNCTAYLHRDIKPKNILVDPGTMVLKLCDLGTAVPPTVDLECNVGSRLYRAPELLLGSRDYYFTVDVWSAGCVLAELFLGGPIFRGADVHDQLIEIIEVLGTPTQEDFDYMIPGSEKPLIPDIPPISLDEVFLDRAPPSGINLLQQLWRYRPLERVNLLVACAHSFFDQLRLPDLRILPNGRDLPPLFNFSDDELLQHGYLKDSLIPFYIRS